MNRVILHSDLNNFYASVECLYNPKIRTHPVAVCGSQSTRHGIVLAKNQIAKKFGVKAGDSIWEARSKCPGLVVV
ncbi:MAG TPA: DNA polymerase IV, partial [Clostridiales bacterium]|nr:DNA polymerase IV [Clostridiales bacterium]